MHTGCRTPFATTVRVINRVHDNTADRRAHATPTHRASLANRPKTMLFVTDFTNRCAARNVHSPNFA